jgi:uncharacterized protein involved in type VI secretion and phage assembly
MSFSAPGVEFSKRGDTAGSVVGWVIFNEDPDQHQRIKVVVPSLLEGAVDTLPWIRPRLYSPFGMGDNYGVVNVPAVGSRVEVMFEDGDLEHGVYVADMAAGTFILPDELKTNYPHRIGYVTPKGDLSYFDVSTGEHYFRHNSGTCYAINAAGDMATLVMGNRTDIVKGSYTLQVGGDLNEVIAGSQTTAVTGNRTATLSGLDTEFVGLTKTQTIQGALVVNSQAESHSGLATFQLDVVANGISLLTHTHAGVMSGSSSTTPPLPT